MKLFNKKYDYVISYTYLTKDGKQVFAHTSLRSNKVTFDNIESLVKRISVELAGDEAAGSVILLSVSKL